MSVEDSFGGVLEQAGFSVGTGGFGSVVAVSIAGNTLDPQPLEKVLTTLVTSPSLQGKEMTLLSMKCHHVSRAASLFCCS